jgi:hypothetical protein
MAAWVTRHGDQYHRAPNSQITRLDRTGASQRASVALVACCLMSAGHSASVSVSGADGVTPAIEAGVQHGVGPLAYDADRTPEG